MTNLALLWLYGLCAWGACLNCPAWASLLVRRWRDPARAAWWQDVPLVIRAGLTSLSFGIAGLAGVRIYGAFFEATPITAPSPTAVLFIGCMAAAEPMFLRVDELHAMTRDRRSWSWRIYWIGAAMWSAGILLAG